MTQLMRTVSPGRAKASADFCQDVWGHQRHQEEPPRRELNAEFLARTLEDERFKYRTQT